jgi:two-component system phosphate regulon sensor histidine kinase PhoR
MIEKPQILVIDDDRVIRMACEKTLKQQDVSVDTAENGKAGLEKLKEKKYDLVLLDLMMPEMSGTQVLDRIKEFDENIVVVIITGFATIESAVETLKKGVYDYIPKPFTPEELRNVVRKGLERRELLLRTEQLRKEREKSLLKLAAQKSRMTTIINCMGEGLIATDKDARLLLINPVACRLLEMTSPCKIGVPIRGNLNCPELENLIGNILATEKFTAQKFITQEIAFSEKEKKIYSVTLAPIKEKRDQISGVALILRDVSEGKKLERMKAEFQKLVSVVAHELKAPINAIDGYLDIILKGYVKDKPEKLTEYLVRSRDKAETLRNLVEDLLSLTSIESGKLTPEMEPVDIKAIILDISKFMENEAQKKRLTIVHDLSENLPLINGDGKALTYLFSNLLSNAIKYNKEGGKVIIKATSRENYLVVSFIDTGYGISEEDLQKIFQEFFRSKNKAIERIPGTGLGLSIAKQIAELHNGFIKVQSKLNEGSCFDVYLPKIIT